MQQEVKPLKQLFLSSVFVFIIFLSIYGLTARSDLQTTDEVAVFATGISWVTENNLAIDSLQWIQDVVNIGAVGRNGHLYAKYFPGNVFTSALIYKIAERQNDESFTWEARDLNPQIGPVVLASSNTGARRALKLNAIFGALGMTSLFLLLVHFYDWKTAILTTLLMGLCTDWWYQSRGFFSEIGAGAFMITSLSLMVYRQPYYSALSLGISLLFRPTNLIGSIIWAKSVYDRGLKTIWSGVFIAAGLAVLLFYNWTRFNSIFDFGYGNESFESNILIGMAGTLFSPGRSVFIYSPILLLTLSGVKILYKKEKSFSIVCLATIVMYVGMVSSWHSWEGGWSWGSRLLTPVLPIMGIFIAPVVESAKHNKKATLFIILLALLGLGIQLLALSSNPVKNLVDSVVYGHVNYGDTIFTIKDSWIAIQVRSLANWNFCKLDAYTLRSLLEACR